MEIIYRALAERNGVKAVPRSSPDILTGALDDHDPLCLEVLDCFCGMLGGAAANLAVTLGSFGGIFIGGGIVPRMGEWFAQSQFRARFEAKGRFRPYVAAIPSSVIMHPEPAFIGLRWLAGRPFE
jgi:glucokinase